MQIFVRPPWSGASVILSADASLTVNAFKLRAMEAMAGLSSYSTLFPLVCTQSFPRDAEDASLVYGGKRLQEELRLQDYSVDNLSSMELRLPLRGGGGDGGATGAESRDCYLKMYAEKKPDKVDPNDCRIAKWSCCCLTSEALKPPCAVDYIGNLFNKENIVRGLMEKSLPEALHHIQSLKDLITIHLTENPGLVNGDASKTTNVDFETVENRFCCPISGVEFNGMFKVVALAGCGHVFSARALKELKGTACLVCLKAFEESDVIIINGTEEEVRVMRDRMRERKKKMKLAKKEKKKTSECGKNDNVVQNNNNSNGVQILIGRGCQLDHVGGTTVHKGGVRGQGLGEFGLVTAGEQKPDDVMKLGKLDKKEGGILPKHSQQRGAEAVTHDRNAKGEVRGRERDRGGVPESASSKRFKALDRIPQNATKEVYSSIFTSSGRSDGLQETYSCRSLPIGRN